MSDAAYIGIIASVAGIVLSYLGYRQGQKDEQARLKKTYREEGEEAGTLHMDIAYIKRRSDDMLLEQKETNKNITILSERVTRVEESSKSAHKRLDKMEEECRARRSEITGTVIDAQKKKEE